MALRFIESDKLKGKKLVYDGYIFHKNREAGSKIYWKCDRYHKFKCRVRVITVDEEIVNSPTEHNHAKDVADVGSPANDGFKPRQMAKPTEDSSRPANQLGNGVVTAASVSKHQHQMKMTESLNRTIMSIQALKRENTFPASSKKLNILVIPDKFTKKSPLLYDSAQRETTRIDESRNEKLMKAMLYQRSQSQNKSTQKINISAALGKPANNERIRKTPLTAASTSSNNSTLSSRPIEIENDSPPAKKPREIHIDIDVEDESPQKPFIQPTIEPPVQKSKPTASLPPSSVVRKPVQKRILVVPNHHQSVMSNLSSLWKAGRLCDAFISNGAVNVKVHKMILGAVCPKVLDVFYNTPQHKLPKVTFPSSVSKEGLLAFAEYMYNGVLDLDPDLLFQMKIIAQRLDMQDFEQLCTNQLKPFLVPNTMPTMLEPMLSEPCSSSGLLQQMASQMASQSQSLQATSRMERISSTKRVYQKGVHVDSLNSMSTTVDNCGTSISLSNLPLVEVRTDTDDMLMEVINNDLAGPSIGDVTIDSSTSVKIEKVEHEQNYGNEFSSSNINFSTSDNINTSNFTHLPHTSISSSQSSPSTTSKPSHTNNTVVTKPLPADEIWTASNKDQGNLVGNVKPADPYPVGLFTSDWANVQLDTQDIKKEYTVE